jgi:hypothetical protein
MNGKFLLFGRREIENSFMQFIDRKIREQRRDERQLAEQLTTKHRFQARKSCIADARSYRVARRLSVLGVAQLVGRTLNPFPTLTRLELQNSALTINASSRRRAAEKAPRRSICPAEPGAPSDPHVKV